MAEILDGRALAEKIKKEVKAEVKKLRAAGIDVSPGLLRVGEQTSSGQYFLAIPKACGKLGVKPHRFELPESARIGDIMKSPLMMG